MTVLLCVIVALLVLMLLVMAAIEEHLKALRSDRVAPRKWEN